MRFSQIGGTAEAVPPPFRPGNPALCRSRPLVTPHITVDPRGLVVCSVLYVLYLFSVYYFVFVFCCLIFLGFPL